MKPRILQHAIAARLIFLASLVFGAPDSESPTSGTMTKEERMAESEKHAAVVRAREEVLSAKLVEIQAELDRLAAAPDEYPAWAAEWAGIYGCGDGLGMNVTMALSPDGGFLYMWRGCMGLYESALGTVREVREDRVLLDVEPGALEPGGYDFIDDELALVRWGQRRYLIPMKGLQRFCDRANDGLERRLPGKFSAPILSSQRGKKWAFEHERNARVRLPDVPAEARAWLMTEPLVATITDVRNIQFRKNDDGHITGVEAYVMLDKGAQHNVRRGLSFRLWPGDVGRGRVSIVQVWETESLGELDCYWSSDEKMPQDFPREGMQCRTPVYDGVE